MYIVMVIVGRGNAITHFQVHEVFMYFHEELTMATIAAIDNLIIYI